MSNQTKKGLVIWFTGLSGSGKTTLATALSKSLERNDHFVFIVDGDQLRSGLSSDLGFGHSDRSENIRRAAEIAKLLYNAGLVVIVTLISPFEKDRQQAKQIIGRDYFFEVFVDCPLEICEQRDVKGLYKRARNGEIKQMSGLDSTYERPTGADLTLRTDQRSIEDCITVILAEQKLKVLF